MRRRYYNGRPVINRNPNIRKPMPNERLNNIRRIDARRPITDRPIIDRPIYNQPRATYRTPVRRVRRKSSSSKGILMLLALSFLVVGIVMLVKGIVDFYAIAFVIMGGIVLITSLVLKGAKKVNKNAKDEEISPTPVNTQTTPTNVLQTTPAPQTVTINKTEDKVLCKYCNCKYDKSKNKCPYCGAPPSR